jgi:hypothetical protein
MGEMSTTIDAEYDGTVFIPIGQVNLKKHGKYRLIIEEESDMNNNKTPWDILREHIGTIDGPEDWSENLDHYLYGSSKRTEEEQKDDNTQ